MNNSDITVLAITVVNTKNPLEGFPFARNQNVFSEIKDGDSLSVYINLGSHSATTRRQEQFLDNNSNVIDYEVIEVV